ncbi:transmembrane protein 222 isoform X2 [Tachypleus tridentatus]|uniref:transmembrane protein 222 isoform X2 n=1 Tax=Tachypleus tridentatus TaxID=6853 RepID=UPI003FD476E7
MVGMRLVGIMSSPDCQAHTTKTNIYSPDSVDIIDHKRSRYPFCIVWTPIPILTWLFPFIGHMGIATSEGIIRDFAGPYFVSENDMAFGKPTKYWKLDPDLASGGNQAWNSAIRDASEEYSHRMGSSSWNMVKLCFLMLIYGKYVSIWGFLKTWMPFLVCVCIVIILWLAIPLA